MVPLFPGLPAHYPGVHLHGGTPIWHILHDGVGYHEPGADYFDRRLTDERRTRRAVNELHRLGYQVTIAPKNA